jgi:peroxiredoxin
VVDRECMWRLGKVLGVVVVTVSVAAILGVKAGSFIAKKKTIERRSKITEAILSEMGTVRLGDTLADRLFMDLDSNEVYLHDLLSYRTVIAFLEPGCDLCLIELEIIQRVVSGDRDNRYFVVVSSTRPAELVETRNRLSAAFPILLDHHQGFADSLGVSSYPFNLVVNQVGEIEEILASALLDDDVERIIEENRAAEAQRR